MKKSTQEAKGPIDLADAALVATLIDGLPHAVRIYDRDLNCVMANTLGRGADQLCPFGPLPDGHRPQLPDQMIDWPIAKVLERRRPTRRTYMKDQSDSQPIFLDVLGIPVMSEEGELRLIVEITRDVTERTLQTAQLRRFDNVIADVVDQLREVIATEDNLSDLPREFHASLALDNCRYPKSCPYSEQVRMQSQDGREMHEICEECRLLQMVGSDHLFRLTSSLDRLVEALHKRQVDLDQAHREVIHSERLAAVGELVAGIAHEINNPIGTILSRLDAMEIEADMRPLPEDLSRDLAVIRNHSQRVARTVESLLQYCRKSPRRDSLVFDLNRVVQESLGFVEDTFIKGNVTVKQALASKPLHIRGEPIAVEQVFVNLFCNAVDAMSKGGGTLAVTSKTVNLDGPHLGVSSVCSTHLAEITVADTGTGIPADMISTIFDPFVSTKQSRGGTGLGLSVSRRIVTELGGSIEVESKVGKGAKFTVRLPLERSVGGESE